MPSTFFFPQVGGKAKKQWSQKMLVFKYSRNWEPDNNSATTESIQPSGDCDMSRKGGVCGGETLKMKDFIPC